MNYFLKFILIISIALISGCKNNEQKISIIEERDLDLQMIDAYNEGINFLDDNYPLKAAKKFNEAELLYPQSLWAPRSSLMSAYSYYYGSYYIDAIEELERFIEIYPKHERIIYAYYLLGMCHYEQIADEKKDLGSIVDAKQNFKYVIINYPDSDFALDSQFKLDLINNQLAAKELYIAKYYIEIQKWIPAINRLKIIVKDYSETVFIEEALHRLVEIYYRVGLTEEAKSAAILLGYNYNSGKWFEQSYKILNKEYKIKDKTKEKNNEGLIKRTLKKILK